MHLPDSDRLNGVKEIPNFWDTVNRVALTLNLTLDQIAEMMEITPYRLRVLQKFHRDPPVSSAMALSKRINVGFDALVLNDFDYKLMAQQYFGDTSGLPAKYEDNALARRRTVIPFFDYIERYFGWAQRALILRKFQMTEGMFINPDAPINVRFAVDLTKYLMDYYRNPGILEHMGWYSARSSRHAPFGVELGKSESATEVYDRAFNEVVPRYFEKNFVWKLIQLDTGSCVVEGKPSEELVATPGSENLIAPGVCRVRAGFLSSLPTYAHLPSMKVKKTACAAKGDDACRYHIDFADQRVGQTA